MDQWRDAESPPKRRWRDSDQSKSDNWRDAEIDTRHTELDTEIDLEDCQQAALNFIEKLVHMNDLGGLSAKDLCILCYFVTKMGCPKEVVDMLDEYALPPGDTGRNFQRKLDTAQGMDKENPHEYILDLAGYNKYDESRSIHETIAMPAHEGIARELEAKANIIETMITQIKQREWASDYFNHPVVKGIPLEELMADPPLALALYVDAAPYTNDESFMCFTIYNLITNQRHLTVLLRKSELCQCGCRGWCTLHNVFSFIKWQVWYVPAWHGYHTCWDGSSPKIEVCC